MVEVEERDEPLRLWSAVLIYIVQCVVGLRMALALALTVKSSDIEYKNGMDVNHRGYRG